MLRVPAIGSQKKVLYTDTAKDSTLNDVINDKIDIIEDKKFDHSYNEISHGNNDCYCHYHTCFHYSDLFCSHHPKEQQCLLFNTSVQSNDFDFCQISGSICRRFRS